jgi:hypothetical protein
MVGIVRKISCCLASRSLRLAAINPTAITIFVRNKCVLTRYW